MASIEQRGGKYRVRWLDRETGQHRSQTCPDSKTAKKLKAVIEGHHALAQPYRPPAPHRVERAPRRQRTLRHQLARWRKDRARAVAAGRMKAIEYACAFGLLVGAEHAGSDIDSVPVDVLSLDLLGDVFDMCVEERGCSVRVARQRVNDLFHAWSWLYADESVRVSRPRKPTMPKATTAYRPKAAPWLVLSEMVLYAMGQGMPCAPYALAQFFTGLRLAQLTRLRAEDLDPDALTLRLRAEYEKTKRGRTVPISKHLVAELQRLGLPAPGAVRLLPQHDLRQLRADYDKAWAGCGVDRGVFYRAPTKIFRSSLISNLQDRGAELALVKWLVGHVDPDVTTASYTAEATLVRKARKVVRMVPPLARREAIHAAS